MAKKIFIMLSAILITVSTIAFPTTQDLVNHGLRPVIQVIEPIIDKVQTGYLKLRQANKLNQDSSGSDVVVQPAGEVTEAATPVVELSVESPTAMITEVPPPTDEILNNSGTEDSSATKALTTATPPPYKLQWQSPGFFTTNFSHSEAGCKWQGVAGQVFDEKGDPITGLTINVTGKWRGKWISKSGKTGSNAGAAYGPGGYEIYLGAIPLTTTRQLRIQVLDAEQKPLTWKVFFNTYSDCDHNLVIINFVKR